jgi:hypothetical protein
VGCGAERHAVYGASRELNLGKHALTSVVPKHETGHRGQSSETVDAPARGLAKGDVHTTVDAIVIVGVADRGALRSGRRRSAGALRQMRSSCCLSVVATVTSVVSRVGRCSPRGHLAILTQNNRLLLAQRRFFGHAHERSRPHAGLYASACPRAAPLVEKNIKQMILLKFHFFLSVLNSSARSTIDVVHHVTCGCCCSFGHG